MGSLIYILYICIAIPMLLLLLPLDKKTRIVMLFFLYGMTINLPVAKVNSFIWHGVINDDMFYLSTCFAPIVEEIFKALPVILGIMLSKQEVPKDQAISWGFACGAGFAIYENIVYFYKNISVFSWATVKWAIYRGIGAGLMHCLCVSFVALGVITLRKNKKLFFSGLTAVLIFAMTYHATYNSLIQSPNVALQQAALFIPIATFIPIVASMVLKRRKQQKLGGSTLTE